MTAWAKRDYQGLGVTEYPVGPGLDMLSQHFGYRTPVGHAEADALAEPMRSGQKPPSSGMGLYSRWAGLSRIADAPADQHGNALGSDYDLVEDGAVTDARIVVLNLGDVYLGQPRASLEKKGFVLEDHRSVRNGKRLREILKDASELWLISDRVARISEDCIASIESYFRDGHGIYIWGDNAPFYVDANRVIKRIFGTCLFGNSPGKQVVSLYDPGSRSGGIIADHLISTGIVNVYEGNTVAEVLTTEQLRPLMYGSNGKVVTAYHDENGCRALVDGGYTRLYCDWDSAGTDRYVVNAAAWLLNAERFAPSSAKLNRQDTSGREESRWLRRGRGRGPVQ